MICLVLSSLVISTNLTAAGEDAGNVAVPTAEFLAQALVEQEEACGKSLTVSYTFSQVGSLFPEQCHYVRTPAKSFLQMEGSRIGTKRCSLDRNSGQSRRLSIRKEASRPVGEIDDRFAGPLGDRVIPDVVRYPLDLSSLLDLVRRSSVKEARQDIDGRLCWLVETPSAYTPNEQYHIWLDPTIGYCPRRVEITRDSVQPQIIDFLDYEDESKGVWFPMEVRNKFEFLRVTQGKTTKSSAEMVIHVSEVKINQPVSDEELLVGFPSGTHVYDRIKKADYIQP